MNADRRAAEITVSSRLAATPVRGLGASDHAGGDQRRDAPVPADDLPAGVERLDPESVELGEKIGRSWILLFGLLPFDYDDITLVRLDPGRGFLERSRMLSQRVLGTRTDVWSPTRTGLPRSPTGSAGSRASALPAAPLRPVIGWFFRHRHKRLRRHFGG